MEKEDLKERLKQEIERKALILERRVNTKKGLASLEMPEDSYEQLMKQIKEKEQEKARRVSCPRKALMTVAMVIVLITITGLGVNGARLYVLKVQETDNDDSFDVSTSVEDTLYVELADKEAYEKIEKDMGILALRLGNKPKGMKLEKVYIDVEMGEAIMEFCCDDHIFTIYENKQNSSATFNTQLDGEVIDKIKVFHLGQTLEIKKVDKGNEELFYSMQLEYGNAFYSITSDIELEDFKEIVYEIMFKNI